MANDNQESVFSDPEGESSQSTRFDTTQSTPQRNSKSRLIMIVGGILLAVVVIFVALVMMRSKPASMDGGALPSAPNVPNIPGAPNQDTVYQELTNEENLRRAERGGTSIPVLTPEENPNAIDPFADTGPIIPVVPPIEQPPVVAPPVEQPVIEQPAPVQVIEQAPPAPTHTQAQYESMQAALQSYLQAWQVSPSPSQEFSFNGQAPDENDAQQGAAGAFASQGSVANVSNSSNGNARRGASFVRTGTVIPAMMLGSLSSDSPGPVVAQITTGPLAGSRLIGSFQSTGKTLLINFNTLSRPGLGTFSINAVAIDDNFTSGMATDVNNHTIRRFVLPTLAAFVQGYGQAFSRSGSTVVIGPGGSTITQDALTADQARRAALAEAGSILTDNLNENANIPPTVRLDCGGGCPVGLLFLSDL